MGRLTQFFIVLLTIFLAISFNPVKERLTVLGVFRPSKGIKNVHGISMLEIIPNTQQCEDLHFHKESNRIFAGCQITPSRDRTKWFPPLNIFEDHKKAKGGSLVVINPDTLTAEHLGLIDFRNAFVTHGIDVVTDPENPNAVYIFAVNHLPNPERYPPKGKEDRTKRENRSQVEIFHHVIGSTEARYVRSVLDPLIRDPNDLVAITPTSFFISNHFRYLSGLWHQLELLLPRSLAFWTDIVHVQIHDLHNKEIEPTDGITATVALDGFPTANGIGRGRTPDELAIVDAPGGALYRVKHNLPTSTNLTIVDKTQFTTTLDNPTYYVDPFPLPGDDASGWVLAGLTSTAELEETATSMSYPGPCVVWHLKGVDKAQDQKLEINKLFQDNGRTVKTATTAILYAIDPEKNEGKKQAWLFVTGFLTEAVVVTKVDL